MEDLSLCEHLSLEPCLFKHIKSTLRKLKKKKSPQHMRWDCTGGPVWPQGLLLPGEDRKATAREGDLTGEGSERAGLGARGHGQLLDARRGKEQAPRLHLEAPGAAAPSP